MMTFANVTCFAAIKKSLFPKLLTSIVVSGLTSAMTFAAAADSTNELPALGADLSQTSVSGLSSGGFMTSQLDTAFSGSFVGAGIVAAGPYYCAGNLNTGGYSVENWENAVATCMEPIKGSEPDPAKLFAKAKEFAQKGLIDDVANLQKQKIYIFSGTKDSTVKPPVVQQVKKYYELAGLAESQIEFVSNIAAGHAIITDHSKQSCGVTEPPYINNCDLEQSHDLLKHIYGNLNPAKPEGELGGKFVKFNQRAYVPTSSSSTPDVKYASMNEEAVVYIPESCKKTACKVHVAIHGCGQGMSNPDIGDLYYKTTGYAEMADSNNMIVLFPQVKKYEGVKLQNPRGCWDFWGYSSDKFYTKEAPQMKAIMNMVKRLGEKQ